MTTTVNDIAQRQNLISSTNARLPGRSADRTSDARAVVFSGMALQEGYDGAIGDR